MSKTFLAVLLAAACAPSAALEPILVEGAKPPEPDAPSISLEDVQTFAAIFRAVKQAYVEPVDDHKLMRDAIRGLLSGLDPHSEFLDSRGMSQLDEDTSGEYAGLGIEVLFLDGALRVISPIDDTPASRAGIRPGDVILRIDGMVQFLFELAGIHYIPIGSDTVQQRQRQIARTLELAGLRSVT